MLRRLFKQSLDRKEIAKRLGVPTNAVNGKLRRMGLTPTTTGGIDHERRAQTAAYNQRRRWRGPPRPPNDDQSVQALRRVDYEREVVGIEDLLTLEERPPDGCCFPVGEARKDPRVYCPNQRVPFADYCEYHLLQMYPLERRDEVLRTLQQKRKRMEREMEDA